jgi:hypothetical protein
VIGENAAVFWPVGLQDLEEEYNVDFVEKFEMFKECSGRSQFVFILKVIDSVVLCNWSFMNTVYVCFIMKPARNKCNNRDGKKPKQLTVAS